MLVCAYIRRRMESEPLAMNFTFMKPRVSHSLTHGFPHLIRYPGKTLEVGGGPRLNIAGAGHKLSCGVKRLTL